MGPAVASADAVGSLGPLDVTGWCVFMRSVRATETPVLNFQGHSEIWKSYSSVFLGRVLEPSSFIIH